MAAALQELGTMQVTASDLRNQIMSVDTNMNQVGRAYLRHLLDSQEHSSISNNLKESQQVLMCTALASVPQGSPFSLCLQCQHCQNKLTAASGGVPVAGSVVQSTAKRNRLMMVLRTATQHMSRCLTWKCTGGTCCHCLCGIPVTIAA